MAARILKVAPLLVLALAASVWACSLVGQNFSFAAAQAEIGFWGRPDYQPRETTIARAGARLELLLAQSPRQPDYLELEARYLAWRGFWAQDIDERMRLNRAALDSQHLAQQSRPAYRQGWRKVVQYASRTPDGAAFKAEAEQRIAALQPAD